MTGIPCMLMRGGTSKGAYFLAEDLPADPAERDELLLRIMGSPDPRQIDGLGGAHPLTSKVAVIDRADGEIGYLFLQVVVDRAVVSDSQNCGNMLAGVGPFAIERGLWPAVDGVTKVPIRMRNTGGRAFAEVHTPGGRVAYEGATAIDGVPGTAAPIVLGFEETAGERGVLPTGAPIDTIAGLEVTCVDNGMPTVVIPAASLSLRGDESPDDLEANGELRERLETLRLEAGARMGLGDVVDKTVPKLSIVSDARAGGAVCTRTFIPHRVHEAIGVLGAASVAVSLLIPGTVAHRPELADRSRLAIEHPTGAVEVEVALDDLTVTKTALVRTARPIMDGVVHPRPRLT